MDTARDFEGRTVLVTGAGRNIGRAIVLEFAARGANVVINARSNRAEANAVADEARGLGARALVALGDVGDPDAVSAIASTAFQEFGRVDIYASNAAVRPHRRFLDVSNDEWRQHLEVNLSASFYLAKALTPSMAENGWGRVIHIGGGFEPAANRVHTITAKQGLLGLTRALAVELGPSGVTVNLVAPASVNTPREPDARPRSVEDMANDLPVGRSGEPADVAWACAFLASPRSGFITGQVIHVNGGRRMS
jgi:NAD(P)-dependent dehydrogenase (short-subunit alcohol dehydrogenase family)